MPIEPFHCVSLSFLLFLSYPEMRARFTPKSGYFRSEKRTKKARIRYTKHEEGRFWSAVANEATPRERTNVGQNRKNGRTEGWQYEGERRERESRVKQRRSRRENENHASAYEERGWNWGRAVSPEKWKFWTMAVHGKEIGRENKAYPYYARSARAGSRKHLESFNRGRSKKLRDLSRHAANLKSVAKKLLIGSWFEESHFKIFDTSYIIQKRAILRELI